MNEEVRHFSLRKLSVGLASVLVGVSIFSTSQTVKADTVADQNTSAVTSNAQSSDTQENKNAVKSSFSSDNQANNAKNNLIQTQVEGKKDQKQDSVPKTQEVNDSSNLDAEKDIVRTSSLQESDNQSNNHAEGNSQTQISQKLDLTKNSQLAKKVLATNLTQDNSTQNNDWADPARGIDPVKFASNGGFDPKIWGTMDTSKWQLDNDGNITGYTGDMSHIIIPNSADFAKAGKSYQQIGISRYEMYQLGGKDNSKANTLAISLTDNKKVKATDAYLSNIFNRSTLKQANLEGLDTSNVTDMGAMFNSASSLTSLDVSNWDTGNVTAMYNMFNGASSLTDLDVSKWNTGNVTDMSHMFYNASSLTSLDVSKWNTSKVTTMNSMFSGASSLTSLDVSHWDTSNCTSFVGMYGVFSSDPKLALILNGDKFADYLVKTYFAFAYSGINLSVKSVTTNNAKLLQLLTSDARHDSATRTIVFTFPTGYSPDLTKYHLIKTGNTYQIKQSADYDKPYLQGTVLINGTGDIAYHHIDTTKPNKLSDTWQPNYDKLVLAHKNSDGSVSFDAIQLPQIPGYKAHLVRNKLNPAMLMVSFMAVPTETKPSNPIEETPSKQPSAPADNPNKPAGDLQQRVVTELNNNDSGWTMPETSSTYTVEVPADDVIDLSDLVIAEPIHAQTTTQIRVTKRFKLSKKHSIKHLKHRKKAVRTFRKYRL